MNAISLLEQNHRDVEEYFRILRSQGASAVDDDRRVLDLLVEALTIHMRMEEDIFYPEVVSRLSTMDVAHAVEEHNVTKPLLQQLTDLTAADETFFAKLEVLEELVTHHVNDEESKLFPKCVRELSEQELEACGRRMEALLASEAPTLFEPDKAVLQIKDIEGAAPVQNM